MGVTEPLLTVAVYSDQGQVASFKILRRFIEEIAEKNGLDSFFEDSIIYYACVDGPVLVIWGVQGERTRILGLTIDLEKIRPEAALRKLWEAHRATTMRIKDVHEAVLRSADQLLH